MTRHRVRCSVEAPCWPPGHRHRLRGHLHGRALERWPSHHHRHLCPSATASPADGFDVFAASPTTTVSLGLYSGLPDPSWELSDEQATALTALLETLPRVGGSAPSGGLGYHGFWIERVTREGMPRLLVAYEGTVSDPLSSHLSYLDDPERSVEHFLLESGRDQLSTVETATPGLDPEPTSPPGS